MKNKLNLILLILLGILPSCIENVNLDSRDEMPVVVNCVLTRDTVQTLRLYRMRMLSETGNAPVEGATVLLQGKDNNGQFQTVAEFHQTEGINWEAKFQPEYDTDYGLLIKVPGEEDITATTRFPEDLRLIKGSRWAFWEDEIDIIGAPITPVCIMYTAEVRKGKWYTEWNWRKKEDGTPFKAYLQVYEKSCKFWVFPHTDTTRVRPEGNPLNIFNEAFYQYNGSRQAFSKYIATNHPGVDRFNIATKRLEDLSYWSRPMVQGVTDFSGWCLLFCPDIPVFDGFVRIDHPAYFRNGLTEKDLEVNFNYSDQCFYLEGDYSDDYDPLTGSSFLNEVHFVSEEYDAYLRALYVKLQNKNDFVLSSYDYDNVYSNIKGGIGIFGADNTTWDMEETEDRLLRRDGGRVIWEELCPDASRKTN